MIDVHINRQNNISVIVKACIKFDIKNQERDTSRYKVYQSSVPIEGLKKQAIKSADGHENLFKEIIGDKNSVYSLR
jgi:hypothetical protein